VAGPLSSGRLRKRRETEGVGGNYPSMATSQTASRSRLRWSELLPTRQLHPNLPDHFEMLKCSSVRSRISESPNLRNIFTQGFRAPPQSGQAFCFGRIRCVSRERCAGGGCRLRLVARFKRWESNAYPERGMALTEHPFYIANPPISDKDRHPT
jgi:hypothetical protein